MSKKEYEEETESEEYQETETSDNITDILNDCIAVESIEQVMLSMGSRSGWLTALLSDLAKLKKSGTNKPFYMSYAKFAKRYKNGKLTDSIGSNTKGQIKKKFGFTNDEVSKAVVYIKFEEQNEKYESERGRIVIDYNQLELSDFEK